MIPRRNHYFPAAGLSSLLRPTQHSPRHYLRAPSRPSREPVERLRGGRFLRPTAQRPPPTAQPSTVPPSHRPTVSPPTVRPSHRPPSHRPTVPPSDRLAAHRPPSTAHRPPPSAHRPTVTPPLGVGPAIRLRSWDAAPVVVASQARKHSCPAKARVAERQVCGYCWRSCRNFRCAAARLLQLAERRPKVLLEAAEAALAGSAQSVSFLEDRTFIAECTTASTSI